MNYAPFEVECSDVGQSFILNVGKCPEIEEKSLVYSKGKDDEFISVAVFRSGDGSHYFELITPFSSETNGFMSVAKDFSRAVLSLAGNVEAQWQTFNAAVNLCYILSVVKHNTLLMHSSAVIYNGKAYLFLGKSGTGKSTHTGLWQRVLDDVVLMNDDHPVVRLWPDGKVMAYGSPWSGKTHCYKNIQAPLGGIIRIVRAEANKVVRLSGIQSYASVMTSCGGMVWEKGFADKRDETLQGIVSRVKCWNMECLPNEEAARMCAEAVVE